jgi:predicted dithiol-disulfide oxidoreductase (DUF899 family)
MGWSFPRASSYGSDFNFDFGVAHTIGRNETGFWWRRHDEYDNQ